MRFIRDRTDPLGSSTMIEELEAVIRRFLLLPLAVPVLLVVGWGVGKLTARGMQLPDGVPARVAAAQHTPRAQLEALSSYMHRLREDGEHTAEYVVLYGNHVRPVEASLERWGIPGHLARRIAWPLVENAYARGLDPATVVAVVLVESAGRPDATSTAGARGLMQIMPLHEGLWACDGDLYDIEVNLCYGTHILASNLQRFPGNEQRALLAYNGCVRGRTTPDCHTYPRKVEEMRDIVRSDWKRVAPQSYEEASRGIPSAAAR